MERNKHNTYRTGFWWLPDSQLEIHHPTCHTRHVTGDLKWGDSDHKCICMCVRSQFRGYMCSSLQKPHKPWETNSHTANRETSASVGLWTVQYIMPLILLERYAGLETSAFTIVFTATCQWARRLQFTPPYIISLKECLQYLTSSYSVKYNNKCFITVFYDSLS
jgi:hypothetical protein